MSRYGIIYMIEQKSTGLKYIGQTTLTVEKRFKYHKNEKRNRHISNVIRKYGREDFNLVELCSCSNLDDLNFMEVYFVDFHNTMFPNGLNHRAGGLQNGKCSEDTKLRISKAKTGKQLLKRRGEVRSIEQRLKISKSLNGKYILATNLDDGRQIIYTTAHQTKLDGHNPSNVVQICKKSTYRTHSKRWSFEYIEPNANQNGSVEFKSSSHVQRLDVEPAQAE